MKPKQKSLLVFGVATCLGALIWLLSPFFTGEQEPWDAQSPYYVGAIVVAGFVPACLSFERFYWSPVGVWTGQMGAVLYLLSVSDGPSNGLFLVGFVFLCVYSLWALAGAALGVAVHLGLRRLWRHLPRSHTKTS